METQTLELNLDLERRDGVELQHYAHAQVTADLELGEVQQVHVLGGQIDQFPDGWLPADSTGRGWLQGLIDSRAFDKEIIRQAREKWEEDHPQPEEQPDPRKAY